MTVLGPVDRDSLGVVLPHEHLFIDLGCLWHKPLDSERAWIVDAPMSTIPRDLLLADPYHSRANLAIEDAELVKAELNLFRQAGGQTVMDLSTRTIGPYPEKLAALSQSTGVHIVAGTGFYTRRAHPDWIESADVLALETFMVKELTEGFGGTGIKAGVIGEIGTSAPVHPQEKKVLEAAARASTITGTGVNIHLAIFERQGHVVLDILESAGADLTRVALSHLDELPDLEYHRSLAERGCFVEFDCFGSECEFQEDGLREPQDSQRLDELCRLLELGFESQLLISQDVCTQMQFTKYGGKGYSHIIQSIVPELRLRGAGDPIIRKLLIDNPARFLCG